MTALVWTIFMLFFFLISNPNLINNKLFHITGATQMVPSPEIVYLEFLFFQQCLKDTQLLHFSALPFSVLTSSLTGKMTIKQ